MEKLKQILLVDDDPVNNYVNEQLLKDIDIVDTIHIKRGGKVLLQL